MSLVYVCRVSNDALALLFAGVAVAALEGVADNRSVPLRCAAAALALGAGVSVKLTIFAFFPAALLSIVLLAALRWLPPHRALLGVGGPCRRLSCRCRRIPDLANLREFGTPFRSAETIHNAAAGLTFRRPSRQQQARTSPLVPIRAVGRQEPVDERLVISEAAHDLDGATSKDSSHWRSPERSSVFLCDGAAGEKPPRRRRKRKRAPATATARRSQALQFGLIRPGFTLLSACPRRSRVRGVGGIITPCLLY